MIKFKDCPKCKGDLYLAEDMFGNYFSCLQCGYLKDLDKQEAARIEASDMSARQARQVA